VRRFAIERGVVPNADSVRAGRRQIRDLEVCAPAPNAAGHIRDALTDHGAGSIQGLREEAHALCVIALAGIDVTGNSASTVLRLISPLDSEVLLSAAHQSGGRHSQWWACAYARAGRSHRRDQAPQEHESTGRQDVLSP